MSQVHSSKVLIIGSGPAGYTAAIYAARANLEPTLVTGLQPGGQLTITTDVENYPGFADAIQGPWLMEQMHKQAENVGTRMVHDIITEVDFRSRPFRCKADSGDEFRADAVIIATGAQARWLGIEPPYLQGRGISGCATCDGAFFRNQHVAVIGGGNSAVEEALYLSNLAAKVTVVHRRDRFRAEKILQDRLFRNPKIEVQWNAVVESFLGAPESGLTGLRLRKTDSGEPFDLEVSGAFVAIGHDPATGLFRGQLEMDAEGYIITRPDSTATSVPGVWAAGDVRDRIYRQAVTAAGMGCMAALEAEKWLAAQEGSLEPAKLEGPADAMIGAWD
jgi:thioredoxin reductase (NADPH)